MAGERCPDCGREFERIERGGRVVLRQVSVYAVNAQRIPLSRYVCPGCAERVRAARVRVVRPPVQLRLGVTA